MQKGRRKDLLCCFAIPAGVMVVGSSRVHVRYITHAEHTHERFVVLFRDTAGRYGPGVLPCTCDV